MRTTEPMSPNSQDQPQQQTTESSTAQQQQGKEATPPATVNRHRRLNKERRKGSYGTKRVSRLIEKMRGVHLLCVPIITQGKDDARACTI
jgi:hypothetical protein